MSEDFKKNFFGAWLSPDLGKNMARLTNLPIDMREFMELGRKNFQAITDAQQVTVESIQAVMQRQSEILSQLVSEQSHIVREVMNESTPEDKIAKGTELVKKTYEKTVHGMREVNDLLNKSNREATDIISKRISSSLNEIKSTIEEKKQPVGKGKNKAA